MIQMLGFLDNFHSGAARTAYAGDLRARWTRREPRSTPFSGVAQESILISAERFVLSETGPIRLSVPIPGTDMPDAVALHAVSRGELSIQPLPIYDRSLDKRHAEAWPQRERRAARSRRSAARTPHGGQCDDALLLLNFLGNSANGDLASRKAFDWRPT